MEVPTAYGGYECLRVRIDRGSAWGTIDHPPINLFDVTLLREIQRIESANRDFLIAHADVALDRALPTEVPPRDPGARLGYGDDPECWASVRQAPGEMC